MTKPITPTEAANVLLAGRSEVRVLAAMSPQLPATLLTAVVGVARSQNVQLTLLVADLTGAWDFLDNEALRDVAAGRLRLVAVAGSIPRHLAAVVDHLPVSLWETDRMIASGELRIDVFVAQVRASRLADRATYGDMIGFSTSALAAADQVGFEVTPPGVEHAGAGGLRLSQADVVVDGPAERLPSVPREPSLQQRAVAQQLEPLIPDGATLQLGIGAIPAALVELLSSRADLGLHSGTLPASAQRLIESGAATGRHKLHQPGLHVATGLLDGHPDRWSSVALQPIDRTHSPTVLREIQGLCAINSGFQVDLTGAVNAEYVNGLKVSSGGGQLDFARGAHTAPQGASVIALPARAKTGPRVVPRLTSAATTPAAEVDYVVTEHGVACLRGLTLAERATAMVEIAHPDDRPLLGAWVSNTPVGVLERGGLSRDN